MADNKKIYENNTLAWVAWNFANQSKSDWQNIAQNERPVVKERLGNIAWAVKDAGSTYLDLKKKAYIDMPIQSTKAAWDFLFGSPQKVETDADRLARYVWQWYTTRKWDDYLYSPDGKRSNVKYDGTIWEPEVAHNAATAGKTISKEGVGKLPTSSELWIQWRPEVQESEPAAATPTTPAASSNTGATTAWGTYNPTTNAANGGRDYSVLKNADVNISQYWDDSSEKNYNNPDLWWGENQKYTWENTKNSQVAYDPNATLDNLDPNYQFGWNAQLANSDQAWYIAKRNDQIASALYNAWLTSIEDVANYLNQQPWFQDSNENERMNTINSVWKRLGQIAGQNNQSDAWTPEANNPSDLSWMESDLSWQWGKLFGKVTADSWNTMNWIDTLVDANSVYAAMNQSRITTVKNLQSMTASTIAASIVSWYTPWGDQGMRDLMQYDPAKYQEIQEELKKLRWQMDVNAIASGEWSMSTMIGKTNIDTDIEDFAFSSSNTTTSAADILKSVNSTLSSNEAASTASEQMANIENDMAKLQNRLKNLRGEANSVFKWDAPDYIVKAYIANRTAEIQSEMSMLEQRYNAAYSRYQNEWEQTKWKAEFWLKQQELQLKMESNVWDQYMDKQWLMLKWADYNGTIDWTRSVTSMSQQEIINTFQNFVSTYTEGKYGWQCGAFVKRYLSELWINLPNISSLASKVSLVDPNITDPVEWDLVIMDSKNYPANWHIAIVSAVDDDGTIHLLESNWNNDELVHTTRTIKPWQKWVYGFFRPTSNANASTWSNEWTFTRKDWVVFDTSDAPTYSSLNYDQQKIVQQLVNLNKNPSTITKRQYGDDFEKILSAVNEINPAWSEDDYKQASSYKTQWNKWANWGWISRNATSVKAAKELYEMVDDLDKIPSMTLNQLINASEQEFWWTKIAAFKTKLEWMITEAAGALKWWNAANSDKDIERMNNILDTKMSKWQIKTALKELVDLLYWKNESEAQTYADLALVKPNPIWVDEVADWMYDELWITGLAQYYNYTPSYWDLDVFVNGGWSSSAVYSAADILSA